MRAVRGPFVRVLLRHSSDLIGEDTENYYSKPLTVTILLQTVNEFDLAI